MHYEYIGINMYEQYFVAKIVHKWVAKFDLEHL